MKKALFLVLFFASLVMPAVVLAQAPPGYFPFGGRIQRVRYCYCSDNFLIKIGGPRGSSYWGLDFLYTPGQTTLYQYYRILRPGAWTLGLWQGAGVCVRGAYCSNVTPGLPITMVGTSR